MKDIRLQFQDADIKLSAKPEETAAQIDKFLSSKLKFGNEQIKTKIYVVFMEEENGCQIFNVELCLSCSYCTQVFLYGSAIVANDWHDLGFIKENINQKIKQAVKLLTD